MTRDQIIAKIIEVTQPYGLNIVLTEETEIGFLQPPLELHTQRAFGHLGEMQRAFGLGLTGSPFGFDRGTTIGSLADDIFTLIKEGHQKP
jgi:hypothetical protein